MNVAFGLKAHSGWTALVLVAERGGDITIIDRRRIELVDVDWARAPYHAAENMKRELARGTVKHGIEHAHRIALREMRAAIQREQDRGNTVTVVAVITAGAGAPMPDWSVDEILDVHFRMHKAEGVLFRDALCRAAEACGVKLVTIPEKELATRAGSTLVKKVAALGKTVGPPWGKDQKDAALAALLALRERRG